MARLYVLSGPDLGKSFEVAPGATLGRSTECAAVLRDHSVSRQHARLECHDGRWTIVDLDSRNGLVVGGKKTPRAELPDGVEFQLGEVLLRFRSGVAETSPAPVPPPSVPAPSAPTPAPKAAPVPPPATQAPVEDEIVLEGAWDERAPAPAQPRAATPPASAAAPSMPAPAPARPQPPAASQPQFPKPASPSPNLVRTARMPASARGLEQRERGVLQYSKVESGGGFFQAELSQQPWFVKLGVWLLALALFALIGWAAFRATSFFRQKVAGPSSDTSPAQDR